MTWYILQWPLLIVIIGFKVFQIRIIFTPDEPTIAGTTPPIYVYGDYFKFSSTTTNNDNVTVPVPAHGTDMFTLHRHLRSDGISRMSDVVPLTNIRELVQLIPVFGSQINPSYNENTSMQLSREFHLNNFANKNTFHAILTYQ